MLTSLVSLQQKNGKNSEKSMKIFNIEGENLERLDKVSENMWLIIILKFTKKQVFTLSLENTLLDKSQGGVKLTLPPAFLGLSILESLMYSVALF